MRKHSVLEVTGKRAVDLGLASFALALLAIPFGIVTWVIRWKMGPPSFFVQARIGKGGRTFPLYKFRTMTQAPTDSAGSDLDAARITTTGQMLRSLSLDELPELANVIRGDMSLVGPRPLLPEYLDRYTARQARRHEVRPGLTGWAQVNGRNALSWEERLEMDVWYVDNWSLGLDLKILWMTVGQVFRREGISANGHATMPEFMGTGEVEDGD